MASRMRGFRHQACGHRRIPRTYPRGHSAIQLVRCGAAAILLGILVAAGAGAATADDRSHRDVAVASSSIGFNLRVGHETVAAGAPREVLLAAVAQWNRASAIEGLPSHLNPEILEPEKVAALLDALPRLPAKQRQRLTGNHVLYLNAPGLMIGASAPTSPASFAAPFEIRVIERQHDLLMTRATVPVDCELARERAREARERIAGAAGEVKALEAKTGSADQKPDLLESLSQARSRRFAIASVWRQNAQAWTRCEKTSREAARELKAAAAAVKSYAVPPSTGMPR